MSDLTPTTDDAELPVLYTKSDGIAHVTLNRPAKHNALSPEMVVRLVDIWDEIADDSAVRVVLVTGAGQRTFSSGGDLGTLIPIMMRTKPPADVWEERLSANRRLLSAALLRNVSFFKPVVAAINGNALAGGAEFILSTDLRVMSSEATIAFTEVRRGLIPGGGTLARLARQVSWANTMELVLTGEPMPASRALEIGLVNRVVPPDDVLATAGDFARRIALGAPVALEKAKEAIVTSNGLPLAEAFEIESRCTKENASTADAKEGPRAFMEKRPPVFKGE
jgi:enoyl-CoA hydratase